MIEPKKQIIKAYTDYLRLVKYYKKQTVVNQLYEISIFLQWLPDNFDFSEVNFNEYLLFRYKNKVYSRSYSVKITQYLVNFYNWLHETGSIHKNPATKLEKPKSEQKIPAILSMHEVFLLMAAAERTKNKERNTALIEMLLATGLRISECLNLKVKELTPNGFMVRGKGGVERLVLLNSNATKLINKYLATKECKPSDYLFTTNFGGQLNRLSALKMIKSAAKDAGLTKKIGAHTLRHSFATLLYEGGANLIEIRDLLGHASVTTTEIYTKTSPNHLRGVVNRLPFGGRNK